MKRITTSEVAKAAGVSIGAASVVLNGGTKKIGVSEKTRLRILRAAAKLGYRLNPAARAVRVGRFGSIALLLGKISRNSLVPGSRLASILDATESAALSLTLTRATDAQLSDERFLHDLLTRLYADGLLIAYNAELPALFTKLLSRMRIPAVWLNAKLNQNAVYPDDRGAARRRIGDDKMCSCKYLDTPATGPSADTNIVSNVADPPMPESAPPQPPLDQVYQRCLTPVIRGQSP